MACIIEKICPQNQRAVAFDVTKEATCDYLPSETRWAKVHFSWSSITKEYVRDSLTDEIYNDDDENCVRFKCLALIPATVVMTVARLVEHVAKCIISLKFTPPSMLYYGPLCLKSASIGLVDPFEGRRAYAEYERALLGTPSRHACFTAPCFQPVNCSVTNKSDKNLTLLALKRKVLKALRE